ncbi:hypothetical protein G1K66_04745 [Tenacibaculum finnmarkense]|uniref:hypothetical protein n=1 Tax=Tenacibaculum finnmarkense TaxID=2781243 RepID=UPI001EFAD554|nr:hypothetical protein [Tenacibaculum finnmarkense]MCG8812566.1 hypothetical protein [Tenacibaculum finnmarkense]
MIKNNKYQSIYNKFKNDKKAEGFELKNITEIYIPFWECKQKIVVEKEVEIDRFSRILLDLIYNDVTYHSEICSFLGIKEEDFTTIQFHYLIKNELIEEIYSNGNTIYKITNRGISFLERKSKIQNIETIDFNYFYNDLSKECIDIIEFLDKNMSKNKRKAFSGYQVVQTHNLKENIIEKLSHKNRPSLNKIKQSDFVSFFNDKNSEMIFYDFDSSDFKPHKRSILFLKLEYENDENHKEYEIRQFKKSVKEFKGNILEENLSKELIKYYKNN